jgi:enoyl-CoA hydratase
LSGLQHLRWQVDGAIATVWLDRPPVNAVTQEMYGEIIELFTSPATYLGDARAIVLTGVGKHFCGGNDLTEFQTLSPENSPARMKRISESFWSIYDSPLPVIAAVRGVALGTGLAIAASCDFVIAGESARFGLPEVGVGVMGGAKHASRLAPQSVVRYLHLTAEQISAAELARYGGVLEIVADGEVVPRALEVAAKIVRHSPIALRYAKQSLNHIEYMDLKHGYEYEQSLSGELSAYSDAKEAVNAFFEDREPQYTGM